MRVARSLAAVVFTLMLVSLAAAAAGAPGDADASSDYSEAFQQLKSLVGTWNGVDEEGNRSRVTYHLTGNGSALVETFYSSDPEATESSMSTVYHLDGEHLMLTHYCGAKNQPRMRASSYDPNHRLLKFDFLDVTNVAKPSDYYTRTVELRIKDDRHAWIGFYGLGDGKEYPVEIELTRAASPGR